MKEYSRPEQMIYEEISNITDKYILEDDFKIQFPDEDYKMWYNLINEKYRIREKHIQGMGNYLFFTKKGKTQFHEFVLGKFIKELNENHIKYEIGKVRKGADLFIFKDYQRYPVELETGLYEHAGTRTRLIERIQKYKEDVIIITVLNTSEIREYKRTELLYLYKEVKILTIEQTVELFKRKQNKLE